MNLLTEIFHDPGLSLAGRTLERNSAKAIIRQERKLLLICSSNGGGYKFPGGGVDPGETDEKTLAREIREECGRRLIQVEGEFGQVVEYKRPFEPQYEVFKMISRYYLCRVEDGSRRLHLEAYEEELGFRPVWVDIEAAIEANMALLDATSQEVRSWLQREIFVLELVKERFRLGPAVIT